MTKLSQKDVQHVADLAKLQLSPEELLKFTDELAIIVEYIGQLNEVDTKNIEPTSQTTGLENIKREDEVKEENLLTQNQALSGTEQTYNGSFEVPGLLENK